MRAATVAAGIVEDKALMATFSAMVFPPSLRQFLPWQERRYVNPSLSTPCQGCCRRRSPIEFDLRLAKPEEIRRRRRDRSVDGEDRDRERLPRLHRIAEHKAIGHIEDLNCGGAG